MLFGQSGFLIARMLFDDALQAFVGFAGRPLAPPAAQSDSDIDTTRNDGE
jgi:hypothetical protein